MTRKVEAAQTVATRSAKTSEFFMNQKPEAQVIAANFSEKRSAKTEANQGTLCAKCEEPIPAKRLELVRTNICVDCMADMEVAGRGMPRHRMEIDKIVSRDGEVEEMSFRLIRNQV